MDHELGEEWIMCKSAQVAEKPNVGNIAQSWQWRERGVNPLNNPKNKTVLENVAEDVLIQKTLQTKSCDLPGYPRSTFLMVFSPDGTKVASTHGNHNVYVSELSSGKHVRILKGHPRTPWCIAFHPSHPLLIGSGCLGGQVRVWDIASGGSEVWNVRNETVVASITFHPREQLLVIATYNELYFWDWSQPAPFTRVTTNNVNEKVRYVAFDALGYKLITGISLWSGTGGPPGHSIVQPTHSLGPVPPTPNNNNPRRDDNDGGPGGNRAQDSPGSAQDMIVNSYQNLVQRYDSLVRNYQRLFMVRHRLTNTPPPPNTTDRGTDPMETDFGLSLANFLRPSRSSTTRQNDATPTPGTSRNTVEPAVTGDGESSRLLNLDVLSIDSNRSRNPSSSNQERSLFGSRSSAFQPLDGSNRSYRIMEHESTRLLPNPFSSSNGTPRTTRVNVTDVPSSSANTSRTSIFTSSRGSSLGRDFALRRRNFSPLQQNNDSSRNDPATTATTPSAVPYVPRHSSQTSASAESQPSTSGSSSSSSQRPIMTNSSTQMSPSAAPLDAQTINESLDLIRDILRDSGTRLLNLITNMSLSTLASVERNFPRRGSVSRAHSDESGSALRRRGGRPRLRLYSSTWRRDFLSTSSDSDSDQSSEVNIFRTRNSTFREDEPRVNDRPSASPSSERFPHPTNRFVFELNHEESRISSPPREPGQSRDAGGINVSLSNNRFRVRTQSDPMSTEVAPPSATVGSSNSTVEATPPPATVASAPTAAASEPASATPAADETGPAEGADMADGAADSEPRTSDFNPDRPSTSRDGNWNRGGVVPPDEAYRKVKSGINALQKHTMQLTNIWLRGNRMTMRELRGMWENLRRRIIMLHRETGRQDVPSYYTRPLLDRCMMLTDMTDNLTRSARNLRNNARNEDSDRHSTGNRNAPQNPTNANNNQTDGERNTSNDNATESRPSQGERSSHVRSSPNARFSPPLRRRLQANRWRVEEEIRRRSRIPIANRLAPRYINRSRREFARAVEISATRHEVRMRAMQVLSVMFNMMMMCLEERGLSQVIIHMLRTLKRALALTCLIVMSNRNHGRSATSQAPTPQRVESLDVVRIQNVEHNVDVNVDGPDEMAPPNNPQRAAEPVENQSQQSTKDDKNKTVEKPSTSQAETVDKSNKNKRPHEETPSTPHSKISQSYSNRVAVQIAAANRNTSATARNRRDLYMESRRQMALHRTNPTAHPLIKKRVIPPVSNYRIPALLSLPLRPSGSRFRSPRVDPVNNEPVAGPSNAPRPGDNPNLQESPGSELMSDFENRVNFIRIAHMQAVRLRNAARNRFRRLQTIRFYTPTSVREMFSLTNNGDASASGSTPGASGAGAGASGAGASASGAGAGASSAGAGASGAGAGASSAGAGASGARAGASGAEAGASGAGAGASSEGARASGAGTRASGVGTRATGAGAGSLGAGAGASNAGARASGVGSGPSGAGLGASNAGARASGAGARASGAGARASSAGARASGVGARASAVGARASGAGVRASGAGARATAVGARASGAGARTSGVGAGPSGSGARTSGADTSPSGAGAGALSAGAGASIAGARASVAGAGPSGAGAGPSGTAAGASGGGGAAEGGARHPLAMFRPHILSARADPAAREELSHQFHTVLNNVAMPLMQMSDLPPSDGGPARLPRIHEYLQPIILAQNAMVVDDDGIAAEANARRIAGMAGLLDAGIISEALPAPSHRVQAWDFTTGRTPEIADNTKNVVVQRCRIHNDASIDISKDGSILVALLPVPRLRSTNHWLGVYSLEWSRLGQCLHTAVLEQSAVSVALSPTARYLAVGLGSRRFTTAPHARNNVIALLYRMEPREKSSRTGLTPIKELEQNWEHGFTSLNCLRWAPQPGQGLVYANNTGQLIIMS